MMRSIGALVLATSMFAGCVDGAVEGDDPAVSTEESAAVVWCNGKIWQVNFYSDASLTTQIGYLACNSCWGPQTRSGQTSNFTRLVREYTCEPN